MPQIPERKRDYNRDRNRQLRGYAGRGMGRGGLLRGVVPDVVPPTIRGNVVPLNPRTMSKRKLVEYLAYVGERGYHLMNTQGELTLVPSGLVDRVTTLENKLSVALERITQLEADQTLRDAGASTARPRKPRSLFEILHPMEQRQERFP